MEQYYKCTPSAYVFLTTVVVSSILIMTYISVATATVWEKRSYENSMVIVLLSLSYIINFLTFAFSPIFIKLKNNYIHIQGFMFHKKIYLNNILKINRIHDLPKGVRRFGSNGVWGYIGILDADKKYYTLFNNKKKMIIVECSKNQKYVLSCNKPDEFINAIMVRLKQ